MLAILAYRPRLFCLFGGLALALMTLMVMPSSTAQAQGFQGSEPGAVGSQRVAPGSRIFNQNQEDVCVKINEVERTGSRSCVYRCGSGQSFERTLSRTRFCEPSLTLTNRQISREVSGEPPTQCRLQRLRLTRTDKICIYNCAGDTVNRSIPISRTCDRNYTQ